MKQGEYKMKMELLKLAVRGSTIQYAARKKKSAKHKIEVLEKKLSRLEQEIVDKSPLFCDTKEQIRKVKWELDQFVKEKTRGAIV